MHALFACKTELLTATASFFDTVNYSANLMYLSVMYFK